MITFEFYMNMTKQDDQEILHMKSMDKFNIFFNRHKIFHNCSTLCEKLLVKGF